MLISTQSGQTGAPFFWGVRRGATISITSTHWMGRKTNKQSISITSIMRWNNLWAIKALLSSGIPFISVQPFEGGTHIFFGCIFFIYSTAMLIILIGATWTSRTLSECLIGVH